MRPQNPKDLPKSTNLNFSARHVAGAAVAWQLPSIITASVVAAVVGVGGLMTISVFSGVSNNIKEATPVNKLRSNYYDQCYSRLRQQGVSTYVAFDRCVTAARAAIPN
jgi:hypothetical protein